MPFDPQTGAYIEPTYNTPGAGVFGVLRMMSEPASFGAVQRTQGQQGLAMLHELSSIDPDVATQYIASPEGQHTLGAFGVSPDLAAQTIQNTPTAKFRSALSDMGETADAGAIGMAGIQTGAIPPTAAKLGRIRKLCSRTDM